MKRGRESSNASARPRCCLCDEPMSADSLNDHDGARVDRCSPYGCSYEHLSTRPGGMRDVDPYDAALALEEAQARGEPYKSVLELARAHKRYRETGRRPTERPAGTLALDAFGSVSE